MSNNVLGEIQNCEGIALSARYVHNQGYALFGLTPDKMNEIGVLVGVADVFDYSNVFLSFTIGGSVNFYNETDIGRYTGRGLFSAYTAEERWIRTFGVPMDLQITGLFDRIGLGIQLFGNVNSYQSYLGVGLCFQIGKME